MKFSKQKTDTLTTLNKWLALNKSSFHAPIGKITIYLEFVIYVNQETSWEGDTDISQKQWKNTGVLGQLKKQIAKDL